MPTSAFTSAPAVTQTSPIADRVNLGISWLDENAPAWRTPVNLDTLDLGLSTDCILGQVFYAEAAWEGYYNGFDYILNSGDFKDAAGGSLTTAWMLRHGFEVYDETYARLTAAWRLALSQTSNED